MKPKNSTKLHSSKFLFLIMRGPPESPLQEPCLVRSVPAHMIPFWNKCGRVV